MKENTQYELTELEQEILEISQELERIDSLPEEILKISIYDFENLFVDYFVGNKNISEKPNIFAVWVEKVCGGNPLKKVSVIDSSGKVLFLVPNLVENTIINPSIKRSTSFSEIVSLMELQQKVSPLRANRDFLINSNEHILSGLEKSSEYKENLKLWDYIIKKYKKDNTKKEIPVIETVNQQNEDDGEWE